MIARNQAVNRSIFLIKSKMCRGYLMTSSNQHFSLYLSGSDNPLIFEEQCIEALNENFIKKILINEDIVEQAINEGLSSVIKKRLCLNPFLEEDYRYKFFETQISSNNYEDFLSEICRETYCSHNLQNNYRCIASKTSSILNWKYIKMEALNTICNNFISKNAEKNSQDTINQIKTKIMKL